jgi:hypothetical protein
MTIRRRVTTCNPERTFRAEPASPRLKKSGSITAEEYGRLRAKLVQ